MESERLMHANIDQEGVDTQNEVVKEEKRLRVDNQPYGSFLAEMNKRAFKEHPYKWTTIGENGAFGCCIFRRIHGLLS